MTAPADDLLIRIETDEGLYGWGEVDTSPEVGRAVVEAPTSHAIAKGLRQILLGQEPFDIEQLGSRCSKTIYFGRQAVVIHTMSEVAEAFPWDTGPRYLLHDRDSIYGDGFRQRVREMAVREVLTAPRSPWQSPYVERLIGSIRRECLDHIMVFNEASLRRTLRSYFQYYRHSRTQLSVPKDASDERAGRSPELGPAMELAEVGRLRHRYERRAAA